MADIVWEEPPPRVGRPYHDHPRIAARLKTRRGVWARVGVYSSKSSAMTTAKLIRNGERTAYRPAGDFDAVCRRVGEEHFVYAKYLGDGDE